MPDINIKITRERTATQQKASLIAGTTRLLVEVLGNRKTGNFFLGASSEPVYVIER